MKKKLVNQTQNIVIVENLEIANTFMKRFIGLMGKRINKNEGLLIGSCNSIHCCFMKIPIDVLFLNNHNEVVRKIAGLKPWRVSPIVFGAKTVIEASEGIFEGVEIGDKVNIE